MAKDKKAVVAIAKEPTVQESVTKVFDLLGGVTNMIKRGETVILKPNAGHAEGPDTAVCTSPETLRAVIREVKKAQPSRIIVAESAAIGCDTMECFEVSGQADVAREEGVELYDIKAEKDLVNVAVRGYKSNIKRCKIPRLLLSAVIFMTWNKRWELSFLSGIHTTCISHPSAKSFSKKLRKSSSVTIMPLI